MAKLVKNKLIQPFIKWAGGKRQLLGAINERLPQNFNNYYEPFIGGGAVLFDLQSENATINDINKELINTYKTIRDFPVELIEKLDELDEQVKQDEKEFYYKARERYNVKLLANEHDIELASLFIFLNKHCFNGLYRVNSKGLFNVPYNKSVASSYTRDNLLSVSEYLKGVKILTGDFEQAVANAKKGDFVFFDSPYAPLNDTSFESYTKEGFSKENHERLARIFSELTDKGVYCMLTNHYTPFIEDLYKDFKSTSSVIEVKRFINSDANNRKGLEIIVWNYQLNNFMGQVGF
ncbi:Dam family site-specific DNA-(adenine-N6)-methyltransferase [Bacillus sp. AFS096315]|uniref:DNA adenine methylase n=1 Tax=Bacillus sp. AFS096315 TaxID=2033517 RepID=UPI000BEC035C|nr:Dam family site-specific DNA-(adenine-N6)-methyltransferase [Bacillus sp. AFS096315]PEC48943.1 DNA adenine methylase [Bacillus sp. AFS096315]